jgi:PAS domain S-box-containing protein
MTPDQFLAFARVLPEPFLLVTSEGEILASNRAAATLIGCRSKELEGKKLFELVTDAPEKVLVYLQTCSRSRQMVLGSLNFALSDGKVLSCRAEGAVVKPSSPTSSAVNLLRLESRAVANLKFVLLNQKIDELTKEIYQRQQAQAALARKNEELQEVIQELKTTQVQLVHTEKMSSLGQLVAGVAHEINNPVNFIHANLVYAEKYIRDLLELVQVYQEEYPPTCNIVGKLEEIDYKFIVEDLNKVLGSMRMGTHRICEIVQSLRNFSRLDEADVKAVDIHEGIESTLVILQHRLKAQPNRPSIRVIKDFNIFPLVKCYPGPLNQVFMNILSNAIDALDASFTMSHLSSANHKNDQEKMTYDNPTIWIRTQKLDCPSPDDDSCPSRIAISIADNALGMSEQIRQQIFNPFFTTKPIGQGTGLGLSISYQIINKIHHGQLHCISEPGQGTKFIIELPIYQ